MTIKAHEYQYDINMILNKDSGNGLITSFALQLDDILSQTKFETPEQLRLLDETFRFLHDLVQD
ncbi:hypothetical protein [Bacillus sp. FJAT-22090]|uniref:hypothetical protein n=1 Tax=Bacillus sp. FJAT-22090 TaxID=1581038 RepID=UPI00119EF28C|nr:hypothetical protein [Bacillus sp. FJAT-22090]